METSELTIRILTEIRDAVRATNGRIDDTNSRLDQTNARLDRLEHRVVESEIRLATAITDMVGTLHEVRDRLTDQALAQRVDRCEREIAEIKQRLP